MRIIKLLLTLILLFGVWCKEHRHCCLRGADVCQCPSIYLLPVLQTECPSILDASELEATNLRVMINGTVPSGLYSVVAFALDEIPYPKWQELAWVVFLAVNVDSEKCLNDQQPCTIRLLTGAHIQSCSANPQQTRMNLFLIPQHRLLSGQDFNLDIDTMNKWDIAPEPHIMEYGIFRDPNLYQGSPVRGNQYELIKCRGFAELQEITQLTDSTYGAEEIETYLFTESLPYARRLSFSFVDSVITLTERMMKLEKIQCDLKNDLLRYHVRSSLHHVMKLCPDFDLYRFLQASQPQMSEILERLAAHASMRLKELRTEYSILVNVEISVGEDAGISVNSSRTCKRHILDPVYARPYWKALYRATRIIAKLELYAEIIYNATGKVPTFSSFVEET
ncbi:uncharacterized protein DEA37_0015211 [Paragonimus westermani]|uniref:Uncharacterized protein n=1 Tax=Paragonimus westermani TaxID=34504 RepID=A0A5J4P1J1_9TREM|nr:uncharacterized protein DEA37_0015211 [Paragonimus westermani]